MSYLEGCTAPSRDENQLHAAVVELIAPTTLNQVLTIQNWYPATRTPRRRLQFRRKRGDCRDRTRRFWTQLETGSAIT